MNELYCVWNFCEVYTQVYTHTHIDFHSKELPSMWKWIGRRTRKIHWTFNFSCSLNMENIQSTILCEFVFYFWNMFKCTFELFLYYATFSHEWQFFRAFLERIFWKYLVDDRGKLQGFDALDMEIWVNINIYFLLNSQKLLFIFRFWYKSRGYWYWLPLRDVASPSQKTTCFLVNHNFENFWQ